VFYFIYFPPPTQRERKREREKEKERKSEREREREKSEFLQIFRFIQTRITDYIGAQITSVRSVTPDH